MIGERLNTLSNLEDHGRVLPTKEKYGWTEENGWGNHKTAEIAHKCSVDTFYNIQKNRQIEEECNMLLDRVDEEFKDLDREEEWAELSSNLLKEYRSRLVKL
jgi:hypothetical protein